MKARNEAKISQLKAERAGLLSRRNAELDAAEEIVDNDAYDRRVDEIHATYTAQLDALLTKINALHYPESRNEWFRAFAGSFPVGEHQPSAKQVAIFARYCERVDTRSGRGCRVGSRLYTLSDSGRYLTVSEY